MQADDDTPSEADTSPRPTRRHAMGWLGAGVAVPGLMASTAASAAPAAAPRPLVDPRTAYPRPPFPEQRQPWPGLASQMTPRPDHGERSYVGSGKLAGRKALITGGDSGLGRAAAIAYAREGADVAIGYLPSEEPDAREVIQLIRAEGRRALALPGDIRLEGVCSRLVAETVAAFGGLDILVNNAARQHAAKSISDISTDFFDWTMKTNLYAMFWLTKYALPHLPPGAAVINTASVVAFDPPEDLLDYSTTKAGIIAFTQSLAKQLARRGVRVNAIAPGPYWTPLQPSGGQLPGNVANFGAETPYGRPGQPAEIAPLFVQLADPTASYTSGNVYPSTGGRAAP
jgi:NAD(P)-dependent dehydrogenase (short-subunit alcohol dehydrogenase family)